MPTDFFIKETNRLATLQIQVRNNDGTAVDLTGVGAGVAYKLWSTEPGTTALTPISAVVTIDSPATAGNVTVAWASGDTATPGRYYGRLEITFQNGNQLFVPTVGYHQLLIDERGPTT